MSGGPDEMRRFAVKGKRGALRRFCPWRPLGAAFESYKFAIVTLELSLSQCPLERRMMNRRYERSGYLSGPLLFSPRIAEALLDAKAARVALTRKSCQGAMRIRAPPPRLLLCSLRTFAEIQRRRPWLASHGEEGVRLTSPLSRRL